MGGDAQFAPQAFRLMRSERASDLSGLSYWRPPRFPKRQYKEWGGSGDEPSVVAARGVRWHKAEVIRQCWAGGLSQGGSGRGCFRYGVAVSLAVAWPVASSNPRPQASPPSKRASRACSPTHRPGHPLSDRERAYAAERRSKSARITS
jgi:hypothetical protein